MEKLFFLLLLLPLHLVSAQVRLSELSAANSELTLSKDENGVFQLGGGQQWWQKDFDDSLWQEGRTPIGYLPSSDSSRAAVNTDLRDELFGRATALYVRIEFEISAEALASSATRSVRLATRADDGFIAYLNGREVDRAYMGGPGLFWYPSEEPFGASAAGQFRPETPIGPAGEWLKAGKNVLAFQVQNEFVSSNDLYLDTRLRINRTFLVNYGRADCRYFIGLLPPSGGVFDYALLERGAPAEPAFEDWVELVNEGRQVVNLGGWGLSDDEDEPLKWTFPANTSIPPRGRILVLADGKTDLNGIGTYLHAGFKLSAGGEDLVLSNPSGTIVDRVPNGYPKQRLTHSYGFDAASRTWGFMEPTPLRENSEAVLFGRTDRPVFTPEGGFHERPVSLTLSSQTAGAVVRYTTDGSIPTSTSGTVYTGPISLPRIDDLTGHVITAAAFKDGLLDSQPEVHSYLVGMGTAVRSVPALLFSGDPEDDLYGPRGLLAVNGGFFDAQGQWQVDGEDSYNLPSRRGRAYEREVRMEFYPVDGATGFREQTGLRVSASAFSRPRLQINAPRSSPWRSTFTDKVSFNVFFRDDYGADELDYPINGLDYPVTRFKQFRVRAGRQDIKNPFIVDEVSRRLYGAMGQRTSTGQTSTLFLNAAYKGFYNLTERVRESYMRSHFGGDEDWDVIQAGRAETGDRTKFDELLNLTAASTLSLENYRKVLEIADLENFADYYLFNIYAATWDWPRANWIISRERTDRGRFRYFVWDAEGAFEAIQTIKRVDHNAFSEDRSYFLSGATGDGHYNDFKGLLEERFEVSRIFRGLMGNPEWRLLMADRIQKHMFNGGALDDRAGDDSVFGRIVRQQEAEVSPILAFGREAAIAAGESFNSPAEVDISFYTDWTNPASGRRTYLLGPQRTDFADNGLWPNLRAPVLSQHGGTITENQSIRFTSSGSPIYYTMDGSDPRELGGAIADSASLFNSSSPLPLERGRTVIKARHYNSASSEWSPLTEAVFQKALTAPTRNNLVISEIMYHPANPGGREGRESEAQDAQGLQDFNQESDFEFIELTNISNTETIDLNGLVLRDAVTFTFGPRTLAPGERVYVVENLSGFRSRYSAALDPLVAGAYGGKLNDGGETLTLALGETVLHTVPYDDIGPWPACADGDGFSLLLKNPGSAPDHSLGSNWECSVEFGGRLSGSSFNWDYATYADYFLFEPPFSVLAGVTQDADGDGLSNLLEFASGTSPKAPNPLPLSLSYDGQGRPVLDYQVASQETGVDLQLQDSLDLDSWNDLGNARVRVLATSRNADNTRSRKVEVSAQGLETERRFYRVRPVSGN